MMNQRLETRGQRLVKRLSAFIGLWPLVSSLWSLAFPRSEPAHHRHARPRPDAGFDLEFVHQPLRAGEPLAEAPPRRVAVAHRRLDVGDAGAAVLEDEPEAIAPVGLLRRLHDHAP